MPITRLVDLTHAAAGAVVFGVPTRASLQTRSDPIRSGGDNLVGDGRIDRGPWDINATIEGQDPLAVPLLAALADAVAVSASGQTVGSSPATYQKFEMAHGVLVGLSLNLQSRQPGTVSASFRNRGLTASALSDELQRSAGTAKTQAARGRVVEFAASGSTFTPEGAGATPVDLLGIAALTWQAQAVQAQSRPSTGALVVDTVDVLGWTISGSITFQDHTLVSGLAPAEYLSTLDIGALAVRCRMAGYSVDETPATDQILTLDRLVFHGAGDDRSSGSYPDNRAEFSGILAATDGTAKTLAQVVAWAAAA